MSETQQESAIAILGQLIKDLSFEHPDPIASQLLALEGKEPELNVETSVSYRSLQDASKGYEVLLNMKISGTHEKQTMFLLELAYASYVAINHDMIPADHIEPVLMV
ncbi:MAG: protein-export chaperone SecB, partial [Alphaproteobacteria bacterium]|nr:protein-export chaperone SecB [Alphaproteobacteria bacterium]